MLRAKGAIGFGILLAAIWCGGCGGRTIGPACTGIGGMGDLVARAELLVLAVYGSGAVCDGAGVAPGSGPTEVTRMFLKGEEIRLDVEAGRHAVVLLAYEDAQGRVLIGTGCAEVELGAGSEGCIDVTLAAPPDLGGEADLRVLDAGMVDAAGDMSGDVPTSDVAEEVALTWDVGESATDTLEACAPVKRGTVALVADKAMVKKGAEAVKVVFGPDGMNYFQASYPKGLSATWDLAGRGGIAFSFDAALPANYVGWAPPGPTVVLCGPNGAYRRYDPQINLLPKVSMGYQAMQIPLAGGGGWMVTDMNGFDPGMVVGIEFHVDPQRSGGTGSCTLWLDDVRFY